VKRRRIFAAAASAAVLVVLVVATIALATASLGLTSTTLAQGTLQPIDLHVKTGAWKLHLKTKGVSNLGVSELRIAPGGHTGWHSHPGPSLVIVKSGTSSFYRGDDPTCTPEVHPAGTAYVDPGGDVHIARNEGTTELVLLTTRLVPDGVPTRIDEPAPGNCDF
jgi:quercetin dioxygenase-like cupin family protein